MLKILLRSLICAVILAASAGNAAAAPEIIEAEGVYLLGDNDSPKSARDAARAEAMRSATEQAGVYIESYSETQNYTLTSDEVRIVAAAVLRVLSEEVTPELAGDVWRYRVRLVCTADTDGIDLAALAGNKAEIARLQRERDELQRANEDLRARYERESAAARTPQAANERYDRIFEDVEDMIERGENEHAVADLSLLLQDSAVTGSARAYALCLRGRAYYELQGDRLALADFAEAERIPRTDSRYPVWRLYQYRGMIYYDEEQYEEAADQLTNAWNASDKTDDELWMSLRRAEHQAQQERRHALRGDGGLRNWEAALLP